MKSGERENRRTFHGEDVEIGDGLLYDLAADPGETTNVFDQHPGVVERLLVYAEQAREELGDTDRPGKGVRPAGMVDNPTPRVMG